MQPVAITLIVFFIMLALSIPIGVSIGTSIMVGFLSGDMSFALYTQKYFSTFDSFPLLAVPFFLLSAELMTQGSMADRILQLCRSCCGHLRGGLAHITIVTNLFYGALSGSASASVAAIGGMMIPAMEKDKYPRDFSAALCASSGCLASLIPPSVPLILYGSFGSVSISKLFIAGIIPGIMTALAMMITAAILVRKHKYGKLHPRASAGERWKAFKSAMPGLGVPIIVLGGIYGGITTPTEAGVMAVVYAFVVETFVYRSLTFAKFRGSVTNTIRNLGMIFFVVVVANAFGTFLLLYNVNTVLEEMMKSVTTNPHVFMFIMLIFFLVIGTFCESTAITIITTPFLVPLCISYGIDPVHFGMFMLITKCIGFITPPVGNMLFIASAISDVNMLKLSKAAFPYVVALMIVTLLIAYVPWFSLVLL